MVVSELMRGIGGIAAVIVAAFAAGLYILASKKTTFILSGTKLPGLKTPLLNLEKGIHGAARKNRIRYWICHHKTGSCAHRGVSM